MYKLHSSCRACGLGAGQIPTLKECASSAPGSEDQSLIPVFDLGLQPLANAFTTKDGVHAGYAPLKVLFCPRCGLAQLSATVDPQILYSHYLYVTSPSETMQAHFDRSANWNETNSCQLSANFRFFEL